MEESEPLMAKPAEVAVITSVCWGLGRMEGLQWAPPVVRALALASQAGRVLGIGTHGNASPGAVR